MTLQYNRSFRLYNDAIIDHLNKQMLSGSYDNNITPNATPITAVSGTVLTPQQIGGGMIVADATSAAITSIQMPTAASLVQAFPNVPPGYAIKFYVENIAAATNSVTLTVNTGLTFATNPIILANNKVQFYALFTVTSPGSQTVVIY